MRRGENTTRQYYVYDAWNRLVAVHADEGGSQGGLIASYEYDWRNYRIQKIVAGDTAVTYDYYYNDNWQIVEVRKDGDPEPIEQYVWDVRYVDAPVVRWHDLDNDGYFDDDNETLYYTNDANMNVTALVNTDGDVVERYMYDPYGKVTVLEADWSARDPNESAVGNEILYSGYRYDGESGLFHVRNRYHDPSLGRFISRDPIGYAGTMSLYEYVAGSPAGQQDPFGLKCCISSLTIRIDPDPTISVPEDGVLRGTNIRVRSWRVEQGISMWVYLTADSQAKDCEVHQFVSGRERVDYVATSGMDRSDTNVSGWHEDIAPGAKEYAGVMRFPDRILIWDSPGADLETYFGVELQVWAIIADKEYRTVIYDRTMPWPESIRWEIQWTSTLRFSAWFDDQNDLERWTRAGSSLVVTGGMIAGQPPQPFRF